jgi:cell division protein FtsW
VALVLLLAERCGKIGQEITEFRTLLQDLLKVGVVALLVFIEPNFSTALIVSVVGLGILFMAGARFKHMAGLVLSFIPVAIVGLLAAPYRRARVLSYLSPHEHAKTVGYQAYQALVGLGNGGLFGVGLGQGKQKLFYLPEPHTDFVFSILGEELGFVGLILVLAAFGFLVWRGFMIARSAPDKQGQLLAFGFTCLIAVYVLVHAAVNVGLAPTTGVPLPFLSYGGMSLVFTMITIGILLNVSSQTKKASARTVAQQKERLSKYQP